MCENTKSCSCENKNKEKENNRPFDLSFAFRKKTDPDNPVVSVNVHGEFAKKVTLVLAAVGAVASLIALFKTYKFIKSLF